MYTVKKILETIHGFIENAIEQITSGIMSINTDHGAIHKGWAYCAHLYLASLSAEGKQVYRFRGPSTKFAHIKGIQVVAQGAPVVARLIKEPTITNAGSEVSGAIQNLNHNSSNTPQSSLHDSSVTYTDGIVWCSTVISGSTGGNYVSSGQFVQSEYLEYITKNGALDYVLELENLSTTDDAEYLNINMFFYEEPQGLVS